ncbi:Sporulation related domain protein [Paenibacillus konkukensis]|uniref:Sporulation related domain protein n=2 Tax=Paenibacillus TaxID=44249 RepID=A0ABY4RZJ2_9BACL|nr:Sporulation related domain protein [Paenibacillus konkukensis]
MTFRFDHTTPGRKQNAERTVKEEPPVIPLHVEEYRVVEERQPESLTNLDKVYGMQTTTASETERKAPLIDAQQLNPYTTDYGGWQSSFDTETNRVERIIRESANHKTNRSQPQEHSEGRDRDAGAFGSGDYVPPQEPIRDHQWYIPEDPVFVSSPPKPNTSWLKVATSVAGAIVTGIAFGFFVLSMFSGDSPEKAAKDALSGQPAAVNQAGGGVKQDAAGAAVPASAAAGAAVTIPAKTYSFLQSGVFSTPQSADAAQADLKKQGFVAVRDSGDKYPVYVGISMTRDEALGLAQKFKQKNIDVIVKNVDLPAVSKAKWSGKTADALPSFINQGDSLLQTIAPLTVAHLSEAKPTPADAAAVQSVKTAHQAWIGLNAQVNEGLADDAKAIVQRMNTAMQTAVVSVDEYRKNPAAAYMWQAQTALMQYVVAEKELRAAVAVQ